MNEAVQEVINVQAYKAEEMGLAITTKFVNFESRSRSSNIGVSPIRNKNESLNVCTDMSRF